MEVWLDNFVSKKNTLKKYILSVDQFPYNYLRNTGTWLNGNLIMELDEGLNGSRNTRAGIILSFSKNRNRDIFAADISWQGSRDTVVEIWLYIWGNSYVSIILMVKNYLKEIGLMKDK